MRNNVHHFLLIGHEGSHNRGCEALVRTTIQILRNYFPECDVTIASMNPEHDYSLNDLPCINIIPGVSTIPYIYKHQLKPQIMQLNKEPNILGLINRFVWDNLVNIRKKRTTSSNKFKKRSSFDMVTHLKQIMISSDMVIIIGGDLFIEDWGVPEYPLQITEFAQELGCKTMLWGASIWPIKDQYIESRVQKVLKKCDLISVRDNESKNYLNTLEIKSNVFLVADSAFLMDPTTNSKSIINWKEKPKLVLGFNGSYIFKTFLPIPQCINIIETLKQFFQFCIDKLDMGIIFIPHDYRPGTNERDFLWEIMSMVERPQRILLPRIGLNAPETKAVFSQCDLCITMRFHASIAALGSGIPTIGIGYSPKFEGLFHSIYGTKDWLISIEEISLELLIEKINLLMINQEQISSYLETKIPKLQHESSINGEYLTDFLQKSGNA